MAPAPLLLTTDRILQQRFGHGGTDKIRLMVSYEAKHAGEINLRENSY